MIEVVIYSRRECHLCDVAKQAIEHAVSGHDLPVSIAVVDIDDDPALTPLYTDEVPVVFIAGRKAFKYRVDEREFVARVSRAIAREDGCELGKGLPGGKSPG